MADTPNTREFVQARDLRIYQMRSTGMSHAEIAKSLNISVRSVTASLQRYIRKINQEAAYSYPEVLRMELDRLDKLQTSVWPLAQFRRETLPDGTEIMVEPDLKAVETILKISQDRRKLLGMDIQKVNIDLNQDIKHNLHGVDQDQKDAIDHKTETLDMLRLLIESRIIEESVGENLLEQLEDKPLAIEVAEE